MTNAFLCEFNYFALIANIFHDFLLFWVALFQQLFLHSLDSPLVKKIFHKRFFFCLPLNMKSVSQQFFMLLLLPKHNLQTWAEIWINGEENSTVPRLAKKIYVHDFQLCRFFLRIFKQNTILNLFLNFLNTSKNGEKQTNFSSDFFHIKIISVDLLNQFFIVLFAIFYRMNCKLLKIWFTLSLTLLLCYFHRLNIHKCQTVKRNDPFEVKLELHVRERRFTNKRMDLDTKIFEQPIKEKKESEKYFSTIKFSQFEHSFLHSEVKSFHGKSFETFFFFCDKWKMLTAIFPQSEQKLMWWVTI